MASFFITCFNGVCFPLLNPGAISSDRQFFPAVPEVGEKQADLYGTFVLLTNCFAFVRRTAPSRRLPRWFWGRRAQRNVGLRDYKFCGHPRSWGPGSSLPDRAG